MKSQESLAVAIVRARRQNATALSKVIVVI
jgi:hypothetical protein